LTAELDDLAGGPLNGGDGGPSNARDGNAESTQSADTKRVFVTSGTLTGAMGGIAGGDRLCAQAAESGKLGGRWVAWLSTSKQEAISRIAHNGRYARLDGAVVVDNKDQLARAALTNPISITELGTPFATEPGYKDIWTGTNASSQDNSGSACEDWTSNNALAFGTRGNAASTATPTWTKVPGFANGGWGCQIACSIYCFEL
jgi:hypothetical protein